MSQRARAFRVLIIGGNAVAFVADSGGGESFHRLAIPTYEALN